MTSYTTKSSYPYPDPTDQVSDYPTTAQSLANYLDNLPNKNRIINGQFDIWQRGTSFSNPATGTYTADRWVFVHNGTGGTRTISQSTIAAGTTIGGMQPRNILSLAVTNAGSPAASSQTIGQRIEDVRTFAGESVTISAWVANNSTALNTLTIKAVQNFGTGGSPSAAVTTTVATKNVTSSYVRISATVTIPSISGKTLGTTDNSYLEIQFDIGAQTGTLLLWGVQVEQGTTATALERVGILGELRNCQRYWVQSTGSYIWAHGIGRTTTNVMFGIPCSLRAAATSVSISGLRAYDYVNPAATVTAAVVDGASAPYFTVIDATSSSLVAYRPYALLNNGSSSYFGFGAEL